MIERVGIIGVGFVGSAIHASLRQHHLSPYLYDKYKGVGALPGCLEQDVLFLALPTLFEAELQDYDISALQETCSYLHDHGYKGLVVIKSTVTPGTTNCIASANPSLRLVHNPEFLSAATAARDFHLQRHIILGVHARVEGRAAESLRAWYGKHYPAATVSTCTCTESEMVKMGCNTFYSVKIQYFNELYALCQAHHVDFKRVRDMMLRNDWIHPMHTKVPGPDGQLSYGGACFPKDTQALAAHMGRRGCPRQVLLAAICERDSMRGDTPPTPE